MKLQNVTPAAEFFAKHSTAANYFFGFRQILPNYLFGFHQISPNYLFGFENICNFALKISASYVSQQKYRQIFKPMG